MTEIVSIAASTPRPAGVEAAAASSAASTPAALPAATASPAQALPPEPLPRAEKSREALQAQIDRVLEDADTSLRFRVDEESDRVVVAVLDGRGDVILQVPNQAALELARRLARTGSLVEATA